MLNAHLTKQEGFASQLHLSWNLSDRALWMGFPFLLVLMPYGFSGRLVRPEKSYTTCWNFCFLSSLGEILSRTVYMNVEIQLWKIYDILM